MSQTIDLEGRGSPATMPLHVAPMLARAGELPADEDGWAFEVKWDGIRAIALCGAGSTRLHSRNLLDLTPQYPELQALATALGTRAVVLDGEIVAFDEAGLPSFSRLQRRMGLRSAATIATRSAETPATYVVFDVLHLDGRDLTSLPYTERRAILETLPLDGSAWQLTPASVGHGREMLAAIVERGMEGVIAKQVAAPYDVGRRGRSWIKVKHQQRQEFVVGGWTEGRGSRAGTIGSLLIGYHDLRPADAVVAGGAQQLVCAGGVGTGFDAAMRRQLEGLLQPLARDDSPFDVGAPGEVRARGKWASMRERGPDGPARVHHVEPRIVCEVSFTEFTPDGTVRHPSFQGLRDDKDPADIVREDRV